MAVLLLVRPIVRHRDRFAQSDERGDGWSAYGEHLGRAREHRGSNAGFLLGHHLARDARDSQTVRLLPSAMMMWPVPKQTAVTATTPKVARDAGTPTPITACRSSGDYSRFISLAGEVHPHFCCLVFDRVAGDIHQRLFHSTGERNWRLVVGHHRRAGVGADADTCRQAQRSGIVTGKSP